MRLTMTRKKQVRARRAQLHATKKGYTMIIEKSADYRPTPEEVREAITAFRGLVNSSTNVFKVGRCDSAGFNNLQYRDMYGDCLSITQIWSGSPQKAKWLEERLIAASWKTHPSRCANEQLGGGGVGDGSTHVVYVVEWPPIDKRVTEVWYHWILREFGEQ